MDRHSKDKPENKHWYDQFYKKTTAKKHSKTDRKDKNFVDKATNFKAPKNYGKAAIIQEKKQMFSQKNIPEESINLLDNFDSVIQTVRPLNSKQKSLLSDQIRQLSQELTTERSSRRVGYMNETTKLTAYTNYFMWWNLIRLTRLFANIGAEAFKLPDNAVCIDIGSGPLTVPIAMYLALPELRKKNITWYCMDYSQTALALGEELFLNTASRILGATSTDDNDNYGIQWKIVRIKGSIGTPIKAKASLITCANMFNEVIQESKEAPDYLAKKYALALMSYADTGNKEIAKTPSILVIEPGVPRSSRFITLLKEALAKRSYNTILPCPNLDTCPLSGSKQRGNGKWCNFTFYTDDAPKKLQKLSTASHLTKDRASLSFIFTQLHYKNDIDENENCMRIVSEMIRLPDNHIGFYACSKKGLTLVVNSGLGRLHLKSGDFIRLENKTGKNSTSKDIIDEKSGATIQAVAFPE
ncbi:MAG: hypothetical protein K6F69_05125 [Treponema sp.]|nr:hypothetical protein [Treponema sp.]